MNTLIQQLQAAGVPVSTPNVITIPDPRGGKVEINTEPNQYGLHQITHVAPNGETYSIYAPESSIEPLFRWSIAGSGCEPEQTTYAPGGYEIHSHPQRPQFSPLEQKDW